MAEVHALPTAGFTRGAVCRSFVNGELAGPNILVVRGMGARTVGIIIEGDAGGSVRLREWNTADLAQVLPAQPYDGAAAHTWPEGAA